MTTEDLPRREPGSSGYHRWKTGNLNETPNIRVVGTAPDDWTDIDLAVLQSFMGDRMSLHVAANDPEEGTTAHDH